MKNLFKLLIVVSIFLFVQAISIGLAESTEMVVIGTNDPLQDVKAVQKAVDQGGIINLKGTFDFGNEGRVSITKDVKIFGEIAEGGSVLTKIKGGFWTLHSPLPEKLPPEAPGPKITIQGIHFDGALWAPVCLTYSSGATISNNKLTNIRPKSVDMPIFGKHGLNMQQGVLCHPGYGQAKLEQRKYIPYAFTGNLIIEGNYIDMSNDVPTKTMAQGVMVLWTTGINAHVQRNTIVNCAKNSIETIDNYLGKDGSGMVVITDNNIITSTEGLPVPTPATPNGIVVGWFVDLSGALDPLRNIKYFVVNNGIRTRGKTSLGIAAFTDGIVIATNGIFSEGAAALPLYVASSDGYIAYNRMEGTSSNPAMMVRPLKPLRGSKNVFVENDLKQFKTSAANVVLSEGSCDNLFIGAECKVSDLGSNNSIRMIK
jgi:hypothetical protein